MRKITGIIFILLILLFVTPSVFARNVMYISSPEGEHALHLSPDESGYRITTVPACTEVEILDESGTWYLVLYNRRSGWINSGFTKSTQKEAALSTGVASEKKVEVKSSTGIANLYSSPSDDENTGSKIKHTVANGMILEIKRETPSGWGLVSENAGKTYAWIKMSDAFECEGSGIAEYPRIEYIYVRSDEGCGVKMWDSPKHHRLLTTVPDCMKLTVREKAENHIYVAYNGINGWIESSSAVSSLSDAMHSTGEGVYLEYVISSDEDVNVYTVPSDSVSEGSVLVGTVEDEAVVFVQRRTQSGWYLINGEGTLGWMKSEYASEAGEKSSEHVRLLETGRKGFVSTEDGEGLQLYATAEDEYETVLVPECVQVKIIAEKGRFVYVENDYASGWAEKGDLSETHENAVESYLLEEKVKYVLNCDCEMMSLPTTSEQCGSEKIRKLKKGTVFEIIKTAETGELEWGLAEVDGMQGWILLGNASRKEVTLNDVFAIAVIVIGTLTMVYAAAMFNKKVKHKKIKINKREKKVEENEDVSDGNSRTEEATSDVPGK